MGRVQLGGKDPAYVRPDADLDYTVSELVDGKLASLVSSISSQMSVMYRRILQLGPKLLFDRGASFCTRQLIHAYFTIANTEDLRARNRLRHLRLEICSTDEGHSLVAQMTSCVS